MSEGGYQAGEVAAWGDGAKAYICDRLGEVGAAEAAIFYPLHHPIFGEVAFF